MIWSCVNFTKDSYCSGKTGRRKWGCRFNNRKTKFSPSHLIFKSQHSCENEKGLFIDMVASSSLVHTKNMLELVGLILTLCWCLKPQRCKVHLNSSGITSKPNKIPSQKNVSTSRSQSVQTTTLNAVFITVLCLIPSCLWTLRYTLAERLTAKINLQTFRQTSHSARLKNMLKIGHVCWCNTVHNWKMAAFPFLCHISADKTTELCKSKSQLI